MHMSLFFVGMWRKRRGIHPPRPPFPLGRGAGGAEALRDGAGSCGVHGTKRRRRGWGGGVPTLALSDRDRRIGVFWVSSLCCVF